MEKITINLSEVVRIKDPSPSIRDEKSGFSFSISKPQENKSGDKRKRVS